jgi:hypothetical protein
MVCTRTVVLALLIAVVGHAHAKEIYKVVGPDGKITFSDKPPADAVASEKYAIKDGPSTPVTAPGNSAAATTANSSATSATGLRKSQAKQAIRGTTPEPSAESSTARATAADPAVERAVIGVLGYEDLVGQSERICLSALPTSYGKYSAATDAWRGRNAAIVRQARKALANQFNSAQQQLIETGIRVRNTNSLAPVASAPSASKIKWCDSTSNEISNGAMDAFNKPNLSGPLANAGL